MAIAVVYRPPALTAEQYKASWAAGPPVAPPPGLLFHASLGEGSDFMTVTFWESLERYEAFAPALDAAMRQIGVVMGKPSILTVQRFFPDGCWTPSSR